MKKIFLFSLVFLLVVNCYAQNIPVAVKNAFAKSFPAISVKKWDKEDGNYEAIYQ